MDTILGDLRHGLRRLGLQPAFTIIAVLSLALGIGANTVIFSIINELFFHSFAVEKPRELVTLYTLDKKSPGYLPLSHLNWRDYRESNGGALSDVLLYNWTSMSLKVGDEVDLRVGQIVSGNYFEVLGVEAELGRLFTAADDTVPGGHPITVLSHDYWSSELGAEPAILGQTININGHPFTVIGIADAAFEGTDVGFEPALWVPSTMNRQILPDPETNWFEKRRNLFLGGIARLAPGQSLAQAQSAMDLLSKRLAEEYPEANEGRSVALVPFTQGSMPPQLRGGLMAMSAVLLIIVGSVLLIACANVANLLLVQATARRREMAVRLAIGGSRWRIVRMLLLENLVLALISTAIGLAIALLCRKVLLGFLPSLPLPISLSLDLHLDGGVLGATMLLSLITVLLFGLVPSLQATRTELVPALKGVARDVEIGGSRIKLRNLFVLAQLALSFVALVVGGLFMRSLKSAQTIDPGFETENLAVISFDLGLQGYGPERGRQLVRTLLDQANALPGVERAAVSANQLLQGGISRSVFMEGASDDSAVIIQTNSVTPDYFDVVGIPIRSGRGFDQGDRPEGVRVAVINETMARRFWPDGSPIGSRFRFFGDDRPVEVIGVAGDAKYNTIGEDPMSYIYLAFDQRFSTAMTLNARTRGEASRQLQPLRQAIRELDPDLPLLAVQTVEEVLGTALWPPRIGATLLTSFGLLALALAAIGFYGVMYYSVSQQSKEISVRMAMGADPGIVYRQILGQGMRLVALGLAIGLVLSVLLSMLLEGLLYGMRAFDVVTFVVTIVLFFAVALVAILVPARKAAAINPVRVLRYE